MLGSVAQVRFYCWGLLLKSAFSVGVKSAFSVGVCYSSQHLPVGLLLMGLHLLVGYVSKLFKHWHLLVGSVTQGSTLTGGVC